MTWSLEPVSKRVRMREAPASQTKQRPAVQVLPHAGVGHQVVEADKTWHHARVVTTHGAIPLVHRAGSVVPWGHAGFSFGDVRREISQTRGNSGRWRHTHTTRGCGERVCDAWVVPAS